MVLEPDKSFSFAGFAQLSISPSGAVTHFTRNEIEQSIPSRFEQIVTRWPSRIAVKFRDQVLTYDTLNKLSNRIAHALRSFSRASKEPVALLVKNDLETVAAILGIAKAGKIYVPLDVSFSPNWAKFILKDTGAKIVLTGKDGLSLAKRWVNSPQNLIGIDSLTAVGSEANPRLEISPGAVSQILYTSGTTGTPKGVMDTHRNMLHYVMRLGNPSHISIEDRITLVRPPSSAGALRNLYLGLLSGAAILPVDLKEVSLAAMVGWLQREKITVFHSSGTVFRHFAQQLMGVEEFPDLRLIRLGSGQVYRNDVELFKRHFPEALLLHVLSSTETNTYRLEFIGKDSQISEDVLPVGYAAQDMDVLILDDCGNALGTNEVGEIAVRSDYIFPGYWNNSALTAAAFVNDPKKISQRIFCTGDIGRLRPDGCLQYLG
ncbi:MAG: AMP-binding protein, partial [Candidatus Binatia bacterium]